MGGGKRKYMSIEQYPHKGSNAKKRKQANKLTKYVYLTEVRTRAKSITGFNPNPASCFCCTVADGSYFLDDIPTTTHLTSFATSISKIHEVAPDVTT